MINMCKKIICTVLIVCSLCALASCQILSGGTNGNTGNNNANVDGGNTDGTDNGGNNNATNPGVYVYNRIVYADESLRESTDDEEDTLSLDDVREAMLNITSPVSLANIAGTSPEAGEIAFGDTDRDITAKAKAQLEAELAKSIGDDTGYIIYVEAPYVAVYWMHPDMSQIAITKFINECVQNKGLTLTNGVAYSELYVKREFEQNKYWLALEATGLDQSIIKSLKSMYNYFDGHKLAGWCANLYDPEIGGFYYSRSARDTEGFLPDIESTSQLLSAIVSNKAFIDYGNNRNAAIPDEIKRKIVSFAQSLQSPDDGYFYHPQWPQGKENLNTDRYGRDLSWATGVITSFTFDSDGDGIEDAQYPLWCAPNGTKCALHNGTDEKCSFTDSTSYYTSRMDGNVTSSLVSTVSAAVASVPKSAAAPTAAVSKYPDYSSRTAFSAWLEAYNANIKTNSGNAHNLAALAGEIAQHGYTDIVLDHLDRVQAELFEEHTAAGIDPTGLWQTDINYRLVWGMLKYGTFYNNSKYGRAIDPKYIPYIVKSCAKVTALPPDGNYYMNDIYNQWTSISNLITNVRRYNPDYLPTIYELVRENASSLIDNTLSKIAPMAMEDGSIAYHSTGITMTTIYGTPISMGVREGDVNALSLCMSMYRAIYSCIGYGDYVVPIFTAEDGEFFLSELENCQPIEKSEIEAITYDFEDLNVPSGVTLSSSSGTGELTVEDDPTGDGMALYFVSEISQSKGDTLKFKPSSNGSSCYIAEFDIYVSSESDNGYLFQNSLGNKYIFTFNKNGNTVTLKDIPSTSHNNGQQTIGTFSVDEWHTIRVEFYAAQESINELDVPMTKIWIDGELQSFKNIDGDTVTASSNYVGADTNASVSSTYTAVEFYSMKALRTYIYLDNCFFSTDNKTFDAEDDTIYDYRDN